MKKILMLILISVIIFYGCKANKAPGAPLDAILTATPTPHYNINFTVFSTQTPLAGATVVLIYPDATRTTTGTTNADGKVNFKISDCGQYTAKFSHSSVASSSTWPLYNYYEVSNGSNDYTVNIDAGAVTLVAQNTSGLYSAPAADYYYFIIYSNPGGMKRKLIPTFGLYHFPKDLTTFSPDFIDTPGNSITVKVSLPNFWHGEDLYPVDHYNMAISVNPYGSVGKDYYMPPEYWGAHEDWLFSTKTAAAVVYSPSTGTLSTTLQLFVSNVTITNVCMRVNKYEYYIGGQWVDHTYYGGTPDYKVGGFSEYTDGEHCFLNANNFQVSLGYPGYSGTSSTKGRLTLDFVDRSTGALINKAVIQN